jgi:hypothetical protein
MNKSFVCFSLILAFSLPLSAGNTFVLMETGPRQVSLGGSGTASLDSRDFNLNPAALAGMEGPELQTSFMAGMGDLQYANIYAGIPLKFGFIGASLHSFYAPDEKEAFGGIATGSLLQYSDSWYGLHYAYDFKGAFRAGLTVKYIYKVLADLKASAFAFDAGVNTGFSFFYFSTEHKTKQNLLLGISVNNIGSSSRFQTEDEALPLSIRSGLEYSPFQFISASYDIEWILDPSEIRQHAGLEGRLMDMFFLRAGLSINPSETVFSTGAGIKVKLGQTSLCLDYSLRPLDPARLDHFLALRVNF